MDKKPILIVDDEPIVRESLRDWLVDAGYAVKTAETGEEGLQIRVMPGSDPQFWCFLFISCILSLSNRIQPVQDFIDVFL